MKAVVVYESLWGNTAAIARSIAEGIGPDARALSTDEAAGEAMAGVDLVVAGAPVIGFRLPTEAIRKSIERDPKHAGKPPSLTSSSMRAWLAALPKGSGRSASWKEPGPGERSSPACARKSRHSNADRCHAR